MKKVDSFVAIDRQGKKVRGFIYKDENGYTLTGENIPRCNKRFMSLKAVYGHCMYLGLHSYSNVESLNARMAAREKSREMKSIEIR